MDNQYLRSLGAALTSHLGGVAAQGSPTTGPAASTTGLDDLLAPGDDTAPPPMQMNGVQLLTPMLEWDWPAAVDGTCSAAQWLFCDTMPQSSDPALPFVSSGDSFSGAYAAFLQLVAGLPGLDAARAAITDPTGDPATSPVPQGWTKVFDASGILRWRPAWEPVTTPQDWMVEAASGRLSGGTLELDAGALESASSSPGLVRARLMPGAAPLALPFASGELQALTLTADAWGRTAISPADWYKSAAVRLGRSGPFMSGLTRSQVFGPDGLFRCRVAELLLAYRPRVELRVAPGFYQRNQAMLGVAHEVEMAGLVTRCTGEVTPDATVLRSVGPTPAPVIVGVLLERFA